MSVLDIEQFRERLLEERRRVVDAIDEADGSDKQAVVAEPRQDEEDERQTKAA